MPWVEALSEPQQLRRCIRDLIALSTLPVSWKDYDPRQVADSVGGALVSMLDAEFVYVAVPGRRNDPKVEVVRTRAADAGDRSGEIRAMLRDRGLAQSPGQFEVIADPSATPTIRLAAASIGFGTEGVFVVGSRQADFPTALQRLLIGIGANEATIALQRWHAETDERRFAALVERSSDLIGFAGLDGSPQYINRAGLRLLGLDGLEQALRLRVLDFIAPEARARVRDEAWPVAMREGRWTGEIGFRHFKNGATIPFLADWFRIDDARTARPMNIAIVGHDLGVQKQAELQLRRLNENLEQRITERTAELEKAHQNLVAETFERDRGNARLQQLQLDLFHAARLSDAGQMAAALAHELNQPLTATTNSINAARRLLGKNGPQTIGIVRETLDEAAQQGLRAGQIIRRLRSFVDRGDVEKRVESVTRMIEDASALTLSNDGTLGIEVRFRFDPRASRVLADRIQIQQVLVNLLRNALQAMENASRRELMVSTAMLDEETVEIAVADTGPGLGLEVMRHLFEPFVSTKRGGMGLGLSICRSIVQAHGGRLDGEPNPGGGAIFRFTLAAVPGSGGNNGG